MYPARATRELGILLRISRELDIVCLHLLYNIEYLNLCLSWLLPSLLEEYEIYRVSVLDDDIGTVPLQPRDRPLLPAQLHHIYLLCVSLVKEHQRVSVLGEDEVSHAFNMEQDHVRVRRR